MVLGVWESSSASLSEGEGLMMTTRPAWPTLYSGVGVHCRSANRRFWAAVLCGAARASCQIPETWRNWGWTDGTATSVSWLGNKGGWKRCVTMNCAIPVVELTRELWEYSTQGWWVDHEAGRWEATQRSKDYRSCLTHSVGLLD